MSAIRQRQISNEDLDGVPKKAASSSNLAGVAPNPTGSTITPRIYLALFSLALAGVLLLSRKTTTPSLSDVYALCSRHGKKIYTVDDNNSQVECLLVNDSHIAYTGSLADIREHWANQKSPTAQSDTPLTVRYINPGSIVVPGLTDSHGHTLEYGASRQLSLESAKTIKAAVALVHAYIKSYPDVLNDTTKYVEGWGWDHTTWPNSEWPTSEAFDSDPLLKDRPVVLQSKDGHALWFSSKVLELSPTFPETVEGGVIVRNSSGKPTGVVLDNAQDLLHRPLLDDIDLSRRFNATVQDALSFGLTSIHDAGFNPVSLEFFKRQASKGDLPIRIYGMTFFDEEGEYWGNKREPWINKGRLNARSVKIFADGALRSGGAALYEPYTDNPVTRGFMRTPESVLDTVIPRFLKDGWQTNVHAIGDRANAIVLDAFEKALKDVNVTASRPRLEHAQFMTEGDMKRVGKLGVIASIQPTHTVSDMWYAEDRLGPERVKGLFAFRSLVNSGARITLGSDFPVEDMNPLAGFYAAITRLTPDGKSPHGPDGWFPEQRLTRTEALRGMTIDPAYASFSEDTLGSLVPGKRADYVVLSQDIMFVPTNEILGTKVIATVIDGKPVFGRV